jgi:CHAT domain-containing protein/Tfp pilus assembly protein PilF
MPSVSRHIAAVALLVAAQAASALTQTPQAPPAPTTPAAPQDRATELKGKLADAERRSGPDDPSVATALNDLGVFYFSQGDYGNAEPVFRRSLAIREKALGPKDPATAQALNNLSLVLQERGSYVEAEPLLERVLRMYEELRGPEHPDVAIALNNLAGLYRLKGDFGRAEPLFQRALEIREKTAGPEHVSVAIVLNNLGLMHQQAGALAKARPLLERSLAIREKALGPEHPDVGRALNNLAVLSQEEGNLAAAETFYLRAIANYEKAFGRMHASTGQALNNLAVVYLVKGDFEKAGPLYEEAVTIRRATLGPAHPELNRALTSQAIYFDVVGRIDDAIRLQTESAEVTEQNLALILASGSEQQKLRYMELFTEGTDITVSMNRQSGASHSGATRLALTTVLRRKGRVLDAMSGSLQTVRGQLSPEDRDILDALARARSELAARVLRGPGQNRAQFDAAVARLEQDVDRLEREASARIASYRSQTRPVTIEAVQSALDGQTALVEIVQYRPFDNRAVRRETRFGAPKYVAYVLRNSGEPSAVDLGDAAAIDVEVDRLRRALRDPRSVGVTASAQRLHRLLLAPLLSQIGPAERLLLSPDGAINLLPIAALVDPKGRFVLEQFEVSYLTSGRDLLRLEVRAAGSSAPLVVANPVFDAGGGSAAGAAASADSRAVDLTRARFRPLPGTAGEAEVLGRLLPDAQIKTGAEATEGVVKRAQAPRILHVATHGFFLAEGEQPTVRDGRFLVQESATAAAPSAIENPLLRSGLAFAGANQRAGGDGDDGILTALEASSLNLWGTRLAVLSACETGVGAATRGEGVYGLRRALVMAGAESQVMSLWQVSDLATRDLMAAFYKKLNAGAARSAALRDVQLGMLRTAARKHPYYWASFILSGAGGPL